jgi:hypothetical protein
MAELTMAMHATAHEYFLAYLRIHVLAYLRWLCAKAVERCHEYTYYGRVYLLRPSSAVTSLLTMKYTY